MVIRISVSRQAPIQFYESENGIDLIFPLVDSAGAPLADAPLAGYPKLFVGGLASSPITLDSVSGVPGSYHHVVVPAAWTVPAGETVHYYEAYVEWRSASGQVVLSDAFEIAVIKAPSTSLQ